MQLRILAICLTVAGSTVLHASCANAQTKTNEELTNDVTALQQQLSAITANLSETLSQVQQNRESINELTDKINEEIAKQNQLLEAISALDSGGQPILRLSAMMEQSPDFRNEVRDAVHRSIDRSGTFTVTNKMGTYQTIQVNRQEYGLTPGQKVTLTVPVGTVTTKLPGNSLKNWTVTAPDYQESIDIVPTSETFVRRPIYDSTTSFYVSPTIPQYYVDPLPTYVSPWTIFAGY